MPIHTQAQRQNGSAQLASTLVMHNLYVSGRRTTVRLEPLMWEALTSIAAQRRQSVHELATEIDQGRTGSLTAAIRVFIVAFYQTALSQLLAGSPAIGSHFRSRLAVGHD